MTDRKTDSNLDAYLSGNSQLSKAYRDGAEEVPPTQLDSAILLRAREHAEQIKARKSSPWWSIPLLDGGPFGSNWALPTALASIVIVVGLVVLVEPALDAVDQAERSLLAPPADITDPASAASQPGEKKFGRASRVQESSRDAGVPSPAPASRVAQPLLEPVPSAPATQAAPKRRTASSNLEFKLEAPQDAPLNPAGRTASEDTVQASSARAALNSLQEESPTDSRDIEKRQALDGFRKAERNRQRFDERRARIASERTRLGEVVRQDGGQNAARLERIRALIDDGEIRLARTILEALLQDYPDLRVPPDISAALSIQ